MAAELYHLVELVQSKPLIASLALLTHYVLHSGEWDHSIPVFFNIWAIAFGGVAAIEYVANPRAKTVGSALQFTATVAALYFSTLVASVLLHRGFFHRLRKVSSPSMSYENLMLTFRRSQAPSSRASPSSTGSMLAFFPPVSSTSDGWANCMKSMYWT
jgi:hypothetical protein